MRYTEDARRRFMAVLAKLITSPKSELDFKTPFELLVAVMLSAQTNDRAVNAATAKLFPKANTPAALAALGAEGIEPYISTLNLYKTKAKHVAEASAILLEQFGGEVPQDFKALVSLPGVGPKTAKVVLNVAFGLPTIAVDTHIFRVCNRTGFMPSKTPLECSEKLEKAIPADYARDAHHLLLLFGRYCCKARDPMCADCPLSAEFCRWPGKDEAIEKAQLKAEKLKKAARKTGA